MKLCLTGGPPGRVHTAPPGLGAVLFGTFYK